jgi:cell division protease FtsH
LEWWGRRQVWWWSLLGALTLAWFGYDVGQMVTRASLVSLGAPTEGTLSLPDVLKKTEGGGGGRIIITSPNSARFLDRSGGTWEVPGFGDRVARDDLRRLRENRVSIDGEVSVDIAPVKTSPRDLVMATLVDLGVKLAFIAFYGFLMFIIFRQVRGSSQRRFRKIGQGNQPTVRISDVAGYEGPKREVTEVMDYLRDPARFKKVGARPARGVLLYGPPGTGKTLMAKAIAGEAQANFYEQSGSSFVQLYVGAGAAAVHALFVEARKHRPCVIFIDEIDAVGGERGAVGTHSEREQTLNQLLIEMNGFDENDGVVIVAATNRIESLDAALLRPGRFDRKVYIGRPGRSDRIAILHQHARTLPSVEANLDFWAGQTPGFVGADLEALVNEAAIEAARGNRDSITDADFAAARDRVLIGARDHGRQPTLAERTTVAGHELGHAVMRLLSGGQVEKVSILPRGQALGVTVSTLEEEPLLQTAAAIQKELRVLMGGRAAEQVLFGEVTTGAADDIERASKLARDAVRRFGGVLTEGPYLPENAQASEAHSKEAARWVQEAYREAVTMLEARKAVLDALTPLLIKEEEVDGAVIAAELGLPPSAAVSGAPGALALSAPRPVESGASAGAPSGPVG